jgi:serine/threonine-protein kinase
MIGERLGKWVIFQELGRGGMGRVYLAQEELTGRKAALKVLAAELAQEVGFLYRFQREIETLSSLEHPNIVRFFESGYENNLYFYAMEYVEGQSLEEVLETRGRLPWAEVLAIAEQVCPALRHCHDHGVIHRDLKPSNLLRTPEGVVKLTDFGIAKVFAAPHLTKTNGIVGTAEFLSPEQAAGKIVGKRSDLYCFGAVLYTLLTGRPPFTGKSYLELVNKHRHSLCDPPHRLVLDIPTEVGELVAELLEKDPDKRPRDCTVLGKRLATIRQRLERKAHQTRDEVVDAPTRADNLHQPGVAGPATLMSRLMRSELQRQQRGGPIARFFNHPVVLVTLLGACLGFLAWTFWPPGPEHLYEQGAQLMASSRLADMEQAFSEYFEPLERRFPEHGHQEELSRFRKKLEAARAPAPSEAQRFYRQAELRRQEGDLAGASRLWRNLIVVFRSVPAEEEWVQRARQALLDLDKEAQARERWVQVRAALNRARLLQLEGKADEANQIWAALEDLYRDDPGADAILREIRQARQAVSPGP